ncbi:MAG: TonB-dependent receptor [Gemmatimonadota bacterium]
MRPLRALFVAIALLALSSADATAQAAPAGPRPLPSGIGEIRGRIADSASGQPVKGGSVTVRRLADSSFIGGALPKPDGTFRVDGLPPGRYTIRIRALGFGQYAKNDLVITPAAPAIDLGTVKLNIVATNLQGQQVTAERDDQALSPDRNTYSTKNMTTAAGGTAIDVLRNIPAVEVDGSNNVSLRGNANVVIQINGRSTPLKGDQLGMFLAQLPANTLQTVEVATNPSAKNDPEGTAGIINIVLNQEAELGLSGGINAGTSSTGQVNLGGNIGKQQGPFTAFLSLNGNRDRRTMTGTTARTNLVVLTPAFVETALGANQQPTSGGGTLRTEYRFNVKNALNFDSYLFAGRFNVEQSSNYTDLDAGRNVIGQFIQSIDQTSHSNNIDFDLAFHHQNQNRPQEMQYHLDVEYSNSENRSDVGLSGVVLKQSAGAPSSIPTETDSLTYRFPAWNLKADYMKPFGATMKLEAGLKGTFRTTSNDFDVSTLTGGTFVHDNARSNGFSYRENIGAAYALLSRAFGSKIQTQTGLRAENVDTRLLIPRQTIQTDNQYTSVYPSAILSYNFTQLRQAKLSYSRRVSRPFPQQLSPVVLRLDSRTQQYGNPKLKPEYTDAFEINMTEAKPWGSLQLNPYVRHTGNAVRSIQFVDAAGITTSTFDNVASTVTIGSDLNASLRRGAMTLFGGGSVYHYSSDAKTLTTTTRNLSTKAVSWSVRSNATWKLSALTDLQAFANYRAPFKMEGGSQLAQVNINIGARYKAWGDAGSIAIRVADPFNMTKFGYRLDNGTVIETSERLIGLRGVIIAINRNFGTQLKLRPKAEPDAQSAATPVGTP